MEKIRLATLDDAAAILEIYRPFVERTAITFETESPTLEEMRKRISETQAKLPWLVWEEEGSVLAYAYASNFKNRTAYDWSVESSIYVKIGHEGKGIGREIYEALIDCLKKRGILNIVGIIALPNPASVALHESLGFEQAAHFKDIGFKLGQWWDVGYWQLALKKPLQPDQPG